MTVKRSKNADLLMSREKEARNYSSIQFTYCFNENIHFQLKTLYNFLFLFSNTKKINDVQISLCHEQKSLDLECLP